MMTKTVDVQLSTIDMVKQFVYDIAPLEGDFDLHSGRYTIDAKSLIGIFSLDLSKPLELTFRTDSERSYKQIEECIYKYKL